MKVVGVRFKEAGKIYYFDPIELDIKKGDSVIVETIRGVEFGDVVLGPKDVLESELVAPLKPVMRKADHVDKKIHEDNIKKAKDAMDICQIKVDEHKLGMKLVDCEYTFDNNKVLFYFTADGRIDFRELVKDLAAIFRTRIELRQIGVRDQAKTTGGLGPCGRVCCCKQYLGDFSPVSIKMAKEQSLSLNPSKISGLCGRLMCCLKYEQDVYEDILTRIPPVGTIVITEDGKGTVINSYTLKEEVDVKVTKNDSEEIERYKVSDIKITKDKDMRYYKEDEEITFIYEED